MDERKRSPRTFVKVVSLFATWNAGLRTLDHGSSAVIVVAIVPPQVLSEMSALVFEGPRRLALKRCPRPAPGPGEVLVAVAVAGVCGSELTSFTGASSRRAPGRVFGHELAGTVIGRGAGVSPRWVGKAVAVNPLTSCGRCRACRRGQTNACPDRVLLGLHVDGGFAEEVVVPAAALRELDGIDELAGALAEPLANGVHATRLLPHRDGDVVVLGAGGIGLSVIAALRSAGDCRIVAVDPVPARREVAASSGADRVLAPEETDGLSSPDHVIDAVGTTTSRRDAISRCAPGGCVVLLGMHATESELPINEAIAKELTLSCSYAYTGEDFAAALRLLRSGAVPYRRWITEFPLAAGQAAFEALVEPPRPGNEGGPVV